MIISMLMALGGGLFRLAPEVLKYFNGKADRAHELKMTELQMQAAAQQHDFKVSEIGAQGDADYDTAALAGLKAAIEAQGRPSGVKWIDGLSSSVRPVLTYWWCIVLYTGVKAATVAMLWQSQGVEMGAAIAVVWTEFDAGVAGSIINFWFLDRVIKGRTRTVAA